MNFTNWQKFQSVSAVDWLRNVSGNNAYEVVWKPLLIGKFGEDASTISMAWFWHRIYSRGSSRGSKGLKEVLVYLDGGFYILIDRLVNKITSAGSSIRTKTAVDEIRSTDNGVELTINGNKEYFDKVVCTTPVPIFMKMIKNLPHAYIQQLGHIRYRAALCIVLTMKKSMLPHKIYWLNINDRKLPFLAVVEHTHFADIKQYGGEHIIYVGNYPNQHDPLLTYSNDKLMDIVRRELHHINPAFSSDWIKRYWIFKDLYAQPIVDTNYHRYIPSVETPINNVYLMTMAQIYPEDRSTDCAVRDARRLTDIITKSNR